MPARVAMEGKTFGRLTVLYEVEPHREGKAGRTRRQFMTRCICGAEKVVTGEAMRSGNTLSCRCLHREIVIDMNTKHGATRGSDWTPEYRSYVSMRTRCCNPRAKEWKNYGGRGIRICKRWLSGAGGKSSFQCFLEDVGERPSRNHSLDRIDNNGDYKPGNVRWMTRGEQNENKRVPNGYGVEQYERYKVSINGRMISFAAACRKFGVIPDTARKRIAHGWSIEEAVGAVPHFVDQSTHPKIAATNFRGTQNGKWTPEYGIYRGMIQRCSDRKSKNWKDYGGRGIRVCDRWLHGENGKSGFACFLAAVGLRPTPKHSIDRIDNQGNYEAGNVRWATRRQQNNNKRIMPR